MGQNKVPISFEQISSRITASAFRASTVWRNTYPAVPIIDLLISLASESSRSVKLFDKTQPSKSETHLVSDGN